MIPPKNVQRNVAKTSGEGLSTRSGKAENGSSSDAMKCTYAGCGRPATRTIRWTDLPKEDITLRVCESRSCPRHRDAAKRPELYDRAVEK